MQSTIEISNYVLLRNFKFQLAEYFISGIHGDGDNLVNFYN